MKPTATELALIAATLSKNDGRKPQDNLAEAEELWLDASFYLAKAQARRDASRRPKIQAIMTFDDYLKAKMPKLSKSYRQRKFYQYLTEGPLLENARAEGGDARAAELATWIIKKAKTDGVSIDAYPGFAEWHKAKVSSSMAENAKKMHAKRKAAKKAEEISQAANRAAEEKKSRIEFHDPKTLEFIAEKEQQKNE
jgi:hypothetical protein